MPDIAARRFSTFRSTRRSPARIHAPRHSSRLLLRTGLRRGHGLRGSARRPHGRRFHSHRGAFHQHSARLRPLLDLREQYCSDYGERGPIHCFRGHLHTARAGFSRLRSRVLPHLCAGVDRRMDWRAVHDSAAAAAHCAGARDPTLSRRHGLRRCADRRRTRRIARQPRFSRPRTGRPLYLLPERQSLCGVAGAAGVSTRLRAATCAQGRIHQRRRDK